ncbi:hypothetical protein MTO96_044715 [Rhipicephalus appendiculatus]
MPNSSRAVFQNGLEKLTLEECARHCVFVPHQQMLAGDYAAAVELTYTFEIRYARLLPAIAHCTKPRCLVIQYKGLQFHKESLLVSRFTQLRSRVNQSNASSLS